MFGGHYSERGRRTANLQTSGRKREHKIRVRHFGMSVSMTFLYHCVLKNGNFEIEADNATYKIGLAWSVTGVVYGG
jgi:hypothetical protein